MKIIILGLKDKKTGSYFVYDVTGKNKHILIDLNETKKIDILDPFPFSHFTSLDKVDEINFEKCYLEVDGELEQNEFSSMKSSGIIYHRFQNRNITLVKEYHDIFQYSLKMMRTFGKNLGTYELLTWVIHNETKSEQEYNAMKKIIFEGVNKKENKQYPLDISLDTFTMVYLDYFRELSEKGFNITFGRYGTIELQLFEKYNKNFSNEIFLYLIENVSLYDYSYLHHPMFTSYFYEEFIKGNIIEEELFCDIESKDIAALKNKGFDIDDLYFHIFHLTLKKFNHDFPEYNSDFFQIFSDPNFEPYIKHESPFDYYCCEDCDGYDIYELYTEEELKGVEVLVDDRLEYVAKLIGNWGDFLSQNSYALFEKVPNEVLENFSQNPFFQKLLSYRN